MPLTPHPPRTTAAAPQPPWDAFVTRLSARVRNSLRKRRIGSWAELLTTTRVDRYGLGTETYLVQPADWRGFGDVAYDDLVAALRAVAVAPPAHWTRKSFRAAVTDADGAARTEPLKRT